MMADETTTFEIMDEALEAGINFIDTVDVYGGPQSPDMEQGKIIYVGSSNFAAWNIAQANETARHRHFLGLVSEQSLYNLLTRTGGTGLAVGEPRRDGTHHRAAHHRAA